MADNLEFRRTDRSEAKRSEIHNSLIQIDPPLSPKTTVTSVIDRLQPRASDRDLIRGGDGNPHQPGFVP
jgi:hypothetical protein